MDYEAIVLDYLDNSVPLLFRILLHNLLISFLQFRWHVGNALLKNRLTQTLKQVAISLVERLLSFRVLHERFIALIVVSGMLQANVVVLCNLKQVKLGYECFEHKERGDRGFHIALQLEVDKLCLDSCQLA
jgi:hypothetical protein